MVITIDKHGSRQDAGECLTYGALARADGRVEPDDCHPGAYPGRVIMDPFHPKRQSERWASFEATPCWAGGHKGQSAKTSVQSR